MSGFASGSSTKQAPEYFGPFVNGRELKSFLREIRKALPYRSCRNLPKNLVFMSAWTYAKHLARILKGILK